MTQDSFNFLVIMFVLGIIFYPGPTDEKGATRVLNKMGFHEIQITGYKYLTCGNGDLFHTGFKAKNAQNTEVIGTVCSGIFKSSTVRID